MASGVDETVYLFSLTCSDYIDSSHPQITTGGDECSYKWSSIGRSWSPPVCFRYGLLFWRMPSFMLPQRMNLTQLLWTVCLFSLSPWEWKSAAFDWGKKAEKRRIVDVRCVRFNHNSEQGLSEFWQTKVITAQKRAVRVVRCWEWDVQSAAGLCPVSLIWRFL